VGNGLTIYGAAACDLLSTLDAGHDGAQLIALTVRWCSDTGVSSLPEHAG
jgi:hypothetical protein